MVDDGLKTLMRQSLSINPNVHLIALKQLSTTTSSIPDAFLPLLLDRIAYFSSTALHAGILIISTAAANTSEAVIVKKLTTLCNELRKCKLSTRPALNYVKLSAGLLSHEKLLKPALALMLVALASIESSSVPKSGPQLRSKKKAIHSSYTVSKNALRDSAASTKQFLFSAADMYAKRPHEALVAMALMSVYFDQLDEKEYERYISLIWTICMKTPLEEECIRACSIAFTKAKEDVIVTKVFPLIGRALLREPQAALPAATAFLNGLKDIDVSATASKTLVPAVVQALKSSEDTRKMGVALAEAIGATVKQNEVVLQAIKVLFDLLKSARYAYQKVSCAQSIQKLIIASPRESEVYKVAASDLCSWLSSKRETNEEVRFAGIIGLHSIFALLIKEGDLSDVEKKCATFLSNVLSGKASDADQRALVTAMSDSNPTDLLPVSAIGPDAIHAMLKIVDTANSKRLEIAARALSILVSWDCSGEGVIPVDLKPKVIKWFASDSSPALQDSGNFSSLGEIRCVIRCLAWMITTSHSNKAAAFSGLARICADPRDDIAAEARREVHRLQKLNDLENRSELFLSIWREYMSPSDESTAIAKSYNFDDGRVTAERLGKALFSSIFPALPMECIDKILLASHHPRLLEIPALGKNYPQSRYWLAIASHLEPPTIEYLREPEHDWLETCVEGIFGNNGLQSTNPRNVQSAIASFCTIAHPKNPYSNRVVRLGIGRIEALAAPSAKLGKDDFVALKTVQVAEQQARSLSEEAGRTASSARKSSKKSTASNARANQQKQAAIDRARAAAASASAAAEKAKAAEPVARAAKHALSLGDVALRTIAALSRVAPNGVRSVMGRMLSVALPLARLEDLEQSSRQAITALVETSSSLLRGLQVAIASSLYGLERDYDVKEFVAFVVASLSTRVPPALEGEDFAMVAPLIKAALMLDPEAADGGTRTGRKGSTARRETIAIVKAAAQVLLEHCKPEAVDAAVVAAGCGAGSWTIKVLEREDGAFAPASDALASLASTVLSPGTPGLSQVIGGIISGKSSVRDAALTALARIPSLSTPHMDCPRDAPLGRGLWLSRYDPDEANAELADELWNNYKHPLHVPEDVPAMIGLLAHAELDIRVMAASAVAEALRGEENEPTRNACVPLMFTMYLKNLPKEPQPGDSHGSSRTDGGASRRKRDGNRQNAEEDPDSGWPAREGVALAIEQMASGNTLALKDLTVAFSFLSGRGLGDSNDTVRGKMSKAAIAVVEAAGPQGPSIILPMIEKQLNASESSAASKEELLHADRTRENLVMCLGSVAGFLPRDDARVGKIADQVIKSAMETPSEVVQNAAARCLVPLAATAITGNREAELTKRLLDTVWSESATYGERRGAAYALAGISRGMGLRFVKRSGILELIHDAVAQKDPRRRQGGFLLIETHAILLEKLFEPYAVTIVPFLLQCMGDTVLEVRNACWAAAQAAMSEISSLGVKMILPSLMDGLKERQWRTKAGSAEVLGAMAYCAPRQLAQCLPQVVPKLAETLADAHPKVVSSAESAINRIAAVVRSPEVRKLSPFLLAALRDPAGRTKGAVDAMLGSEFVHAIDAASLALLIPPLHRGLRDRSSELKRKSAAIVGSMCNNVSNHDDVVPYLDLLLPSLRVTLLDAIPDVRRTSARAIGALAVSLGEEGMPDIVPWLVSAILGGARSSVGEVTSSKIAPAVISSSAERSGAAMGLAEVAASMTERRLEDVLGTVLQAGHSSPEAREGGLMLIASMPRALGERFENRLGIALEDCRMMQIVCEKLLSRLVEILYLLMQERL